MTTTKRKDRFSVDAESLNNLNFMSLSTDDEFTRLAEQMQSGISLKRSRTEEVTDDLLSLRLCSAPKHRALWLCPRYNTEPRMLTAHHTTPPMADYQMPIPSGRFVSGDLMIKSSATKSLNHAADTQHIIASVLQQMELNGVPSVSQMDFQSSVPSPGSSSGYGSYALVPWVEPVKPEQMVARAVGAVITSHHLRSCLRSPPERSE
eukprot:CAMPEP_0198200172 /NCGR_PEP_ID=MMETSP1445-20131203/3223_1 /TAXON_ID=36898 /ORGANISM="Pyramimonas sp., Strain CCMP2087" /LENGTH=205 /DNA_ID=CAMNT_0043870147 /DNA_START=521 /DNA_END=1135 /DNA_ORIENTATION=+